MKKNRQESLKTRVKEKVKNHQQLRLECRQSHFSLSSPLEIFYNTAEGLHASIYSDI